MGILAAVEPSLTKFKRVCFWFNIVMLKKRVIKDLLKIINAHLLLKLYTQKSYTEECCIIIDVRYKGVAVALS